MKKLLAAALAGAAGAQLARLVVPGTYRGLYRKYGDPSGIANVLHALALQEGNGKERPGAISPVNPDGSIDYGLMQINSKNFARLGLDASSALDPEKSVAAAAQLIEENRAAAPQLGLLDQLSVYNAGFSVLTAAAEAKRPKFVKGGAPGVYRYLNQSYVMGAAAWYALVSLASYAPIPTPGWSAKTA